MAMLVSAANVVQACKDDINVMLKIGAASALRVSRGAGRRARALDYAYAEGHRLDVRLVRTLPAAWCKTPDGGNVLNLSPGRHGCRLHPKCSPR